MTGGTTRAGLALMHGDVTREILGAFYQIYSALGYGFVEAIYQRSLPLALARRGVKAEREVPMKVTFLDTIVGDYRADLIVEGKVIVETKTAEKILPVHEMQLVNYLRATGINVGLILNFGPRPTFRRMFLSSPQDGSVLLRA
jgi:GxxExxY protein